MSVSLALLMFPMLLQTPVTETVRVSGQALSAADQTPVPRGTVAFLGGKGKPVNLRIREGRFSGEVPAREGYLVLVWAPGFADYRANNVNVYPGMEPLRLRLYPTSRIGGWIVDSDGKGIRDARVGFALDPRGEDTPLSVFRSSRRLPTR